MYDFLSNKILSKSISTTLNTIRGYNKIITSTIFNINFFWFIITIHLYDILLIQNLFQFVICRSSYPEVFLVKGVLKICSIFTGVHPCQSVISIKLLCSFIEITLCHGCSPINLLHVFKTRFSKNTSGRLLLYL